ncbi:MAG TPA: hypothetical protein V6C46_10955, partial [Coleofasciculaceae cyanobacterium]
GNSNILGRTDEAGNSQERSWEASTVPVRVGAWRMSHQVGQKVALLLTRQALLMHIFWDSSSRCFVARYQAPAW